MKKNIRSRPKCYEKDGLPIYYSVYNEKDAPKLNMSFRRFKETVNDDGPGYGKVLYEETHKLPKKATEDVVQAALASHAPEFWRKLSQKEPSFWNGFLSPEEGLPLAIAWAIDQADLIRERKWSDSTIERKSRLFKRLSAQGWGAVPIGRLDASFCGDTFQTEFSAPAHFEAVSFLRHLSEQEFGHKRLSDLPWPKRVKVNRPRHNKKSSTYTNQHIRLDVLTREQVRRITDEMLELLSSGEEWRNALSLLLCLTMHLPLEEICYIRLSSIGYGSGNTPTSIHISGTLRKKESRFEGISYPEDSPKNRTLPIPTKVASGMKKLLEKWKPKEKEDEKEKKERKKEEKEKKEKKKEDAFQNRYLIPHRKFNQRGCNPEDIKEWINTRLREQLRDRRMHDGKGKVIPSRDPYLRCLATAKQTLVHLGFESDEQRYFFGSPPNTTAGEYYCDFTNFAEQRRMQGFLDQWLGLPLPAALCDSLWEKNPAANTEISFGASRTIACVVLTLHVPPVPEEQIPIEGYQLQFNAKLGFSLTARALPLAA